MKALGGQCYDVRELVTLVTVLVPALRRMPGRFSLFSKFLEFFQILNCSLNKHLLDESMNE